MRISESNTAIIGASFGDEAKGSIAWRFSKDADVIVKYNGSGNAGHTVYYKGQKIVRRQLPSADFSGNSEAFVASNALINVDEFVKEVELNESFFPGDPVVSKESFTSTFSEIKKTGRWLGALATTARKKFNSLKDGILEWENITREDSAALGCSCCGTPHYFRAENKKTKETISYYPERPFSGNRYEDD